MQKHAILTASAGLLALALAAPPAEAANRFAVACITNQTNLRVSYSVQWGNGQWQRKVLQPGASWRHFWPMPYSAPYHYPHITLAFDDSLRPECQTRTYTLVAYGSPDQDYSCALGKRYAFIPDGRGFLDVRGVN